MINFAKGLDRLGLHGQVDGHNFPLHRGFHGLFCASPHRMVDRSAILSDVKIEVHSAEVKMLIK